MKRQLNFWSKPNDAPETDLVNTSLSIEDNRLTIKFVKPGHVKPIAYIVSNLNEEESFDLKKAFELSGCEVFQDEMDERMYFANIARLRDHAKASEKFVVCISWSVIYFIVSMIVSAILIKLSLIISLFLSLILSVLVGILIRNKFYTKVDSNE